MKRHLLRAILIASILILTSCSGLSPQATQEPEATSTRRPTKTATPDVSQFAAATLTAMAQPNPAYDLADLDLPALQQELSYLGYLEVGIPDGQMDAQILAAISHFQLLNHLPITGSPEEAFAQVFSTNPIGYYPPWPFPAMMDPNDASAPICDDHGLQERLASLGYMQPGTDEWISGAFGPLTQKALKEFQKDYQLNRSGKPDLETWQALFSPARSLAADGSLNMATAWATNLYVVGPDVIAMDWDGSHLWLAVSEGSMAYQNYLLRIDPNAHPAEAVLVIRPRECEAVDPIIANMLYAEGKIWLLYNTDQNGFPEPMLQAVDVETGLAEKPFKFADCPDQFCFQAFALGYHNNTLWAAANDEIYGINPVNGSVKATVKVGFMAGSQMPFDGECFWYLGEGGIQAFNPAGGTCRGTEAAMSMAFSYPVTDGHFVWASGYDGTLSRLDLSTEQMDSVTPPGYDPAVITYANDTLWISDRTDSSVTGMSVADSTFGAPLPLDGSNPLLMLAESHYLWVYLRDSGIVQRLDVSGYSFSPDANRPTPTGTPTPSATLPAFQRVLSLQTPRLQGEDVSLLQQRLLELGFVEVGEIDGYFGPMTEQAVKNFQSAHNLGADGVVGQQTWDALFR